MTHDPQSWARLSAIFTEALGLPPEQRAAFVEHAAAGDAELAREALSLLAAHGGAGEFLESPAAQLATDLLGGPTSPWRDGAVVGSYRVHRQIGRGGMGVVYLAEDTRLGRSVALKVLDPRYVSDEKRRGRLRKEAQAAARLRHPNIATVYALEEIDGQLCIAAEYVEGRTLRDIIEDRVPDPRTVIGIATQIGRALDAAHHQHVVHRDLKPDNVMVDGQGVVRLLDFGIAVTRDESQPNASRLTDPGVLVGTPGYMAPEQLEGRNVDFRTDHFLFGIVVFELATGVHPFRGATRAATDARILTAAPARISDLEAGPLRELDGILRICLRKAPSERYQSTSQLVQALAQLDTRPGPIWAGPADPASAKPTAATVGPLTWWRVHQVGVSIAVSGMLIGAWWLAQWIGAPVRYPLFFGLLAVGVADVTLRMNLLFVERQTPSVMPRQLRRSAGWLRRLGVVFGVVYALAALAVSEAHPAAAGFALAAAAILTITAIVIEPATTDEAHGTTGR